MDLRRFLAKALGGERVLRRVLRGVLRRRVFHVNDGPRESQKQRRQFRQPRTRMLSAGLAATTETTAKTKATGTRGNVSEYCTIWGISVIVSQYRAIWGH